MSYPVRNAKNSPETAPAVNENSNIKNSEMLICPHCQGLFLINLSTGERFNARCNTYKCEVCGKRKAQRLYSAIKNYVSSWDQIRMWTFTVKASVFEENKKLGNKLISKIWHYFITYTRRCLELSKKQRRFDYIKILEFHRSGLPHLHVLVDKFLPWAIVQGLWERAIRKFSSLYGKVGNAFVSFSTNASGAANYVSKYVVKAAIDARREKLHLWSKSGRGSIFIKNKSEDKFLFVSFRNLRGFVLYLSQIRELAQKEEEFKPLFDEDLSPPDDFVYYLD